MGNLAGGLAPISGKKRLYRGVSVARFPPRPNATVSKDKKLRTLFAQ